MGEYPRKAVITLQGGGVYGLTLLGQLSELIYGQRVEPIALAGTSAGAIVAALYCAGLSPNQIIQSFADLAAPRHGQPSGTLINLLGPFDPLDPGATKALNFPLLRRLQKDFARRFMDLPEPSAPAIVIGIALNWMAFRLSRYVPAVKHALANLGLFRGENLELTLNSMMLASDALDEVRPQIAADGNIIRFGHLRTLCERGRVPALFITATNLSTGKLELFNSLDEQFDPIPVASAARASASFPLVLRPTTIEHGTGSQHYYVDGGLISNFPAWVFGSTFGTRKVSRNYRQLQQLPFVTIGLRRSPEVKSELISKSFVQFARALIELLSGGARDQLEEAFLSQMPLSITIAQRVAEAGGPPNVMDVDSLDENRVRIMVDRGKQHARACLGEFGYRYPDSPEDVTRIELALSALVAAAELILADLLKDQPPLRAGIFLPKSVDSVPWLNLVYRKGYDQADPDYELEFPAIRGIEGDAFTRGKVTFELSEAGLARVESSAAPGTKWAYPFRPDRRFLAAFPIYNPQQMSWSSRDASVPSTPQESTQRPLQTVFGVLTLDGPISAMSDNQIDAVAQVARSVIAELGELFRDRFGKMPSR